MEGEESLRRLIDRFDEESKHLEHELEHETHQQNSLRMYSEAGEELFAELRDAGYDVRTLDDLDDLRVDGSKVVPVLLKWLPRIKYPSLKSHVVTTLGRSWAKPTALVPLLQAFRSIDPNAPENRIHVRFSIGESINRLADESIVDDLIDIATNPQFGLDRSSVVESLGKMKKAKDRVVPVLCELLNDQVAPYAIMALGQLTATETRPLIEPFLEHKESWVRQEAKRALAKFDRYEASQAKKQKK